MPKNLTTMNSVSTTFNMIIIYIYVPLTNPTQKPFITLLSPFLLTQKLPIIILYQVIKLKVLISIVVIKLVLFNLIGVERGFKKQKRVRCKWVVG